MQSLETRKYTHYVLTKVVYKGQVGGLGRVSLNPASTTAPEASLCSRGLMHHSRHCLQEYYQMACSWGVVVRCVVLCCVVLCCVVLCCVVLCCVVLCCVVLCCVVLCRVVLCCVVLWYALLQCVVL
jgi:hypothetical protein